MIAAIDHRKMDRSKLLIPCLRVLKMGYDNFAHTNIFVYIRQNPFIVIL